MATDFASMLFMSDNKAVANLSGVYSICSSPHSPLSVAPRTSKRIRPLSRPRPRGDPRNNRLLYVIAERHRDPNIWTNRVVIMVLILFATVTF